ncbi:MAG: UDP-N-acetylmuramate dehydrogenase [Actinobacteria bacterium]|nr:UDP-N-acetylmuramate dehydrogenase [Actinomycetota bacterium]
MDKGKFEAQINNIVQLLGPKVQRMHPLGTLTTYRVGGPAWLFYEIETEEDLKKVHEVFIRADLPLLILGMGSNLLVADSGFCGLVVTLSSGFSSINISDNKVFAGSALPLPVLGRNLAKHSLSGMEWAVGVPGSVGGAIYMNAGGHGSCIRDWIKQAGVWDLTTGEDGVLDVAQLGYSYRHSSLAEHQVVLWGEFQLEPGDSRASQREIAEIVRWRRENQPGGHNAGSVFKNPPFSSAGRLIQEAGLKGHRIGSAWVSPKHANFFQVDAKGSADDVRALIDYVRNEVEKRLGVLLELEIKTVGFGYPSGGSVNGLKLNC